MSNDKPEECEFCGWPTDELSESGYGPRKPWLCEVCRHTPAGNAARSQVNRYGDIAPALQAISWGTNRILDEIRRRP